MLLIKLIVKVEPCKQGRRLNTDGGSIVTPEHSYIYIVDVNKTVRGEQTKVSLLKIQTLG